MSTRGRPEGRGTEGAELGAVWGGVSPPQPTREYGERRDELPQWGFSFSVLFSKTTDPKIILSLDKGILDFLHIKAIF